MGVGFFDLLSSCFIALSVIMIHDGLMIADRHRPFDISDRKSVV